MTREKKFHKRVLFYLYLYKFERRIIIKIKKNRKNEKWCLHFYERKNNLYRKEMCVRRRRVEWKWNQNKKQTIRKWMKNETWIYKIFNSMKHHKSAALERGVVVKCRTEKEY